ncbi:microcin C transport system substrate-binding protein [Breoghania corrubedonensis]|uniref:Microcin C transport system substrate-binding protein n=1 Tax=Breoghania corrubedonensis TaxID=665038 RepID=A0A2T5VGD0_9HYPH|nr:extracellular solute-binding protein [Breoghania corrubedonensis]PTW62824.1 microcin C transport system substrate-binding protein [Breoghania corrubedonensis]
MSGFFTRTLLAAFLLPLLATASAFAADGTSSDGGPQWTHATALTGTPKYGPHVDHFDYVNPDAPKGGTVRLATSGGFDTFNPILSRGNPAPGLGLTFDRLMDDALDEMNISATYGLIAEATRHPDDDSWVEFRINRKARWHDGQPITADDVVWSFNKLVEVNPSQRFYYRNVAKAEKVADNIVRFTFDVKNNRELPQIMGQVPVFPRHWWEGTDAKGNKRDISKGTLEPPLGSGPYRIKSFEANRSITYERVKDYWAADLPVRKGTNNFDEIRYDSYMDSAVSLEAFKGDQYDFRDERAASVWAKRYDFPAVHDGRVILQEFPDKASGVMQAFVPNLRLEKFADPRVREALNYAYDFETTNEIISAGLLKRVDSFFAGTELASSGLPDGEELKILESVRDEVPPEVFTTPYENPVGGNPQKVRANLRHALKLLTEAGYRLDGRKLVDASGKQLSIEFLYYDKGQEKGLLPYLSNLNSIGIATTPRLVDMPQYINRLRNRDFEILTYAWVESLSPGNEQRDYWGSQAADQSQSRNIAGIKDKAVDTLIDKVIYAGDRAELVAATHALDRVLLWKHFVIPQFYSDVDRTARWDRFGHPETMPQYTYGFPQIWWWDKDKAARVGPQP